MADKTFTLQIISPTRIFFDEEVDMVEMRTTDRKSTRLNSSHRSQSRMPSSA